jgi:hypothetical protein
MPGTKRPITLKLAALNGSAEEDRASRIALPEEKTHAGDPLREGHM